MVDLTIRFATKEQALAFATWLCEAGEQDYWMWGEIAVRHPIRRTPPKDFVAGFDYHNGGGSDEDFCKDMTIRTRGVLASEDDDGPQYCANCKGHGIIGPFYPELICPMCNGSGLTINLIKGAPHDTGGN